MKIPAHFFLKAFYQEVTIVHIWCELVCSKIHSFNFVFEDIKLGLHQIVNTLQGKVFTWKRFPEYRVINYNLSSYTLWFWKMSNINSECGTFSKFFKISNMKWKFLLQLRRKRRKRKGQCLRSVESRNWCTALVWLIQVSQGLVLKQSKKISWPR